MMHLYNIMWETNQYSGETYIFAVTEKRAIEMLKGRKLYEKINNENMKLNVIECKGEIEGITSFEWWRRASEESLLFDDEQD